MVVGLDLSPSLPALLLSRGTRCPVISEMPGYVISTSGPSGNQRETSGQARKTISVFLFVPRLPVMTLKTDNIKTDSNYKRLKCGIVNIRV